MTDLLSVPVTLAYYPLFLIVTGTIFNALTLAILCRRPFRNTKSQPIIHYMRAIAVFDFLQLFGWNLQHYLTDVHGFSLETYTVPTCKIFLPYGYFTVQTACWLRIFVSLDRYLSLRCLQKTWFSRPRNVLLIIISVVMLFFLFNLHITIFGCFYAPDGTVDTNAPFYQIFPIWDYIDLGVYNLVPFVLMMTFNIGTMYHLVKLRHTSMIKNSRIQHRPISIALLTITCLFLLMTLPGSIVYGFFRDAATNYVSHLVDAILFTYSILSFPSYMITFKDFRQECIAMITCSKNNTRVAPTATILPRTFTVQDVTKMKPVAYFQNRSGKEQIVNIET